MSIGWMEPPDLEGWTSISRSKTGLCRLFLSWVGEQHLSGENGEWKHSRVALQQLKGIARHELQLLEMADCFIYAMY